MKRVLLAVLFVIFDGGCSMLTWPNNIEWARANNIQYDVKELPKEEWRRELSKYPGIDRDTICFFKEPNMIYIKEGNTTTLIIEDQHGQQHVFTRPNKDCLNHELGHLREFLEGKPYHSEYAK